jgi:hypothetical protein
MALCCIAAITGGAAESQAKLKVLLVVGADDARSQRIAAFLDENGLAASLTTYESVTKEACDRHDVVLADSDYFRQALRWRGRARAFPPTSSPIVAVGFLGTELIEGHKIAMTSGYI